MPYPISKDDYTESYPVVVANGSLYFESDRPGGIGKQDDYRAQYSGNGKFDTPKSIRPIVNTAMGSGDAYVSPDESYLIVNSRSADPSGLYVSFKKNGDWQKPIFLKEPINSEWTDFCPYMIPDSKYFFFSRKYGDPPGSGWAGVIAGTKFQLFDFFTKDIRSTLIIFQQGELHRTDTVNTYFSSILLF